MKIRRSSSALTLVALTVAAGTAGAQASDPAPVPDAPPGAEDATTVQARAAFRLGSALAAQGQWKDALAAFERAATLRDHPVTTYNIGYVERALGNLTRARKLLRTALAGGLPQDLETAAEGYLTEIQPRLAHVTVNITSAETTIAIDGRPLDVEREGARPLLVAGVRARGPGEKPPTAAFELLVDPGERVLVLTRPGATDTVVNQSFEPGATLTLRLGVELNRPTPAPPVAPTRVTRADPPPPPSEGLPRWPAWVGYGVGAAGIGVGAVFGVRALGKKSELDETCPEKRACPEGTEGTIGDLVDSARLSTIGFAVGGAGVAFGTIWLLVSAGSSEFSAERAVRVRPELGPGWAGVRASF